MMRDKLTKTGHRAWYYRFRKLGIATAFVVALGLVSIVPVRQITLEIKNLQAAQRSEEVPQEAAADLNQLGEEVFDIEA